MKIITKDLVADSRIELETQIAKYFEQYHPAGYGTKIKVEPFETQGKWYCMLERFNSCD